MTDTSEHTQVESQGTESSTTGKKISMTDLPEALRQAAARLSWTELMPVQCQTIPAMLGGQDIMVQSQTGSGKTGAFLLPILHRLDPDLGAPQALVLAPTRELAVQVSRDAEELGRELRVRSLPIYGGVGYKAQIQGLEAGAQLIIGTPGRILDHLLQGTLSLDRLKILVFDEADRMLSMGFYPDMKQLQRYLPRGLQSAMFSATYPGHVQRLAQQFLQDPQFISLSQDQVHASDVLHVVYKVPAMQKSRILGKIIEQENPSSGIIFCNTKADVHFVTVVLRRFGYDVGELSADLSQGAREEVLDKLRRNKLKFLVATDVAARGIDIHELSHVFQYQPPQDHEAYVHRTGRTGRAGAAGVAISLVSGMEEIELDQIAKKFSIVLEERQVPTDEELETLISQRAVFLLEAQLRQADNIQKERMQRFMRIVAEVAANEESRPVLAMLMDEFYQKTFHAPLEQPAERLAESQARSPRPGPQAIQQGQDTQFLSGSGAQSDDKKRRRKRSPKKNNGSLVPVVNHKPAPPDPAPASIPSSPAKHTTTSMKGSNAPVSTDVVVTSELLAAAAGKDEFGAALTSIWDGPEQGAVGAVSSVAETPKKRRRRRPRKPAGLKVEAGQDERTEQTVAPLVPVQPEAGQIKNGPSKAPAKQRRPAESQPAPAKSKKKIFLE